jgi:hypothetical protein
MSQANANGISKWIIEEISTINLGDERLNKRCVKLLEKLGNQPSNSIPSACESWSETIAAYRFFANEQVTPAKILAPHKDSTLKRIRKEKVVLLVQDTTGIDYSGRENIAGLGVLAAEYQQGFYLHPLLAITPQKMCLGVVNSHIWSRSELGNKRRWKKIQDKESYRWLKGYEVANEIAQAATDTMIVTVGDRESDIYEIFAAGVEKESKAYWLVRSQHNRILANDCGESQRLKEILPNLPRVGCIEFTLEGQKNRKGRLVKQEIRVGKVKFKAPRKQGTTFANIEANVVFCRETHAPKGEKPIEWILLTNVPITDKERTLEIIQWYLCRWQIEIYFRILKSGCLVEELQLEAEDRIENCLALYMIIAWRVLFITMMGRSHPNVSSNIIFTNAEWCAAYAVTQKKAPPKEAPPLKEIIKMVAQLGGYLNRKSDGDPGAQTIWIGIQRLRDIALGWSAFQTIGKNKRCV